MVLATIPELGQLNRQQAAALAGLRPYNHDSGQWTGKRCISGGRAEVRRALYMAALSANRSNHLLKPFYDRLIAAVTPQSRPHGGHAEADRLDESFAQKSKLFPCTPNTVAWLRDGIPLGFPKRRRRGIVVEYNPQNEKVPLGKR